MASPRDERVRRALLFMPGDDRHKIAKGAALEVDSVIMDLEDGVALNNKEFARQTIQDILLDKSIEFGKTERLVRLNQPRQGLQTADIAVTIKGQPDGYVLPKVESAKEIQQVSHTLLERELTMGLPPQSIRLLAIVETARGIVNLKEIAGADTRLVALIFGAEDLAGNIGATRSQEGFEVFYARSALVIHAAAYGLQAIDTPYVHYKNIDGLKTETQTAMQMGYSGKLAIHPAQVEPIEQIFTPSEEAITRARTLIDAHDQHQKAGTGVFSFEGQMVDMPMIVAARQVLSRAKAAGLID